MDHNEHKRLIEQANAIHNVIRANKTLIMIIHHNKVQVLNQNLTSH